MKELSIEEIKVVSGGHNTIPLLHLHNGNPHVQQEGDTVPGVAEVVTRTGHGTHGPLPGPQVDGGYGAGGING